MEKYLQQLIDDINNATQNISWPVVEKQENIWDWVSEEEEDRTAKIRDLEEWTGIRKEMLTPESLLNDKQLSRLFKVLKVMLDAYNCCFVVLIEVPERLQYTALREYFDQPVKIRLQHMGFFELCRPGTEYTKCALKEYCHCAFFKEFFKDMIDEVLSPEEERKRMLDIEVRHIKRKYGDDWMKYYPYHLDKEYDDESGNPYDYGFGDEEDDDNWWKK